MTAFDEAFRLLKIEPPDDYLYRNLPKLPERQMEEDYPLVVEDSDNVNVKTEGGPDPCCEAAMERWVQRHGEIVGDADYYWSDQLEHGTDEGICEELMETLEGFASGQRIGTYSESQYGDADQQLMAEAKVILDEWASCSADRLGESDTFTAGEAMDIGWQLLKDDDDDEKLLTPPPTQQDRARPWWEYGETYEQQQAATQAAFEAFRDEYGEEDGSWDAFVGHPGKEWKEGVHGPQRGEGDGWWFFDPDPANYPTRSSRHIDPHTPRWNRDTGFTTGEPMDIGWLLVKNH